MNATPSLPPPDAEELARLTLQLCEIPSETGHEHAIADWVEARCKAAAPGGSVFRTGNSLVCDPWGGAEPPAGTPRVALVGHLDTVRCAEEQPYEVRDGRVYGCGASDMKAGVAVMLALLERWQQWTAARPVWIFYEGEEGPELGNGLGPVLKSGVLPKLDLAFVLEPTDRALQLGCMGVLHAELTVHGARAHSARPWQGENAVYRAIPLLERFAQRERREVRFGELVFYEVMVVTQARTSNSRNVVPDTLQLNVNMRFAPGRTVEEAEQELRDFVGAEAEVAVADTAPAGAVYLNHPLLEPWRLREGLEQLPKQAWTDVARLTAHGIPAVNFGPGETEQCHQANEWCSIDSLVHCYGALSRFFAGEVGGA